MTLHYGDYSGGSMNGFRAIHTSLNGANVCSKQAKHVHLKIQCHVS